MRGGRSLVVLLVIALGLGAYIYFVEARKNPADSIPKRDKVFTGVESGKIEEIEVKAAGGDVTKLKKSGNDWQIVAPEATSADQGQVGTIASTLESLEQTRVVDEKPADPSKFGVQPARISVSFKPAGQSTAHKLEIGSKTPNGSDLYARADDNPRIILIGSFVEDSLNRTTFDLRDKAVLKFARDNADSLKLEPAGSPAVTLTKKGPDWRLTTPVDTKADNAAVEGILSKIGQAQMKALVPASNPLSPEDAKKFGLDKPQTVATVGVGSTRASLAIGSKKDDTTVYARDLSRPQVFSVESSLVDDLKKPADDLRSKDLFEFRAFNARSIDITYKGVTYSFAKQKEAPKPPAKDEKAKDDKAKDAKEQPKDAPPPADVWKQLKPAAKDANQTQMNDLITNLSNLRAEKFADKAQTSGDDLVLVVKFGEESSTKEEKVTFRKSGTVVHAIRQGESGAAIVTTADYDRAFGNFKDVAGIK